MRWELCQLLLLGPQLMPVVLRLVPRVGVEGGAGKGVGELVAVCQAAGVC